MISKEHKEGLSSFVVQTVILDIAFLLIASLFGRPWHEALRVAIAVQLIRLAFVRER